MSRHAQRLLSAVLATVMLVLGGAAAATAQTDVPPSGEIGAEVVGGVPATQLYPGLAALEYDSTEPPRDDYQTCTSVLIETGTPGWAEWGLTASHCATNRPASARSGLPQVDGQLHAPPLVVPTENKNFQLRAGDLDRTQVPALKIKKFVVNPWWEWIPFDPAKVDKKPAADLVLFQLEQPVRVRAATLPDAEPRPGSTVTLAGWGRTSNGSAATPTTAYELTTTVLPQHLCAAAQISRYDVCTHNPGGKAGACNADSGAPVYKKVDGQWVAVALVSRGGAAACGSTPDAQTGIAYFRRWIDGVTQGRIRADLPLTAAQGGPIPHASISFTTTEKVYLSDRVRKYGV